MTVLAVLLVGGTIASMISNRRRRVRYHPADLTGCPEDLLDDVLAGRVGWLPPPEFPAWAADALEARAQVATETRPASHRWGPTRRLPSCPNPTRDRRPERT